jgi:alpha-D-ribose 1-methylphosphonate 5-triphosphate diphosphatase
VPPRQPKRPKVFCFFFSKKKYFLPSLRRPYLLAMTLLLTNAAIVLPDAVMRGTVRIDRGFIAEIQPGPTAVPGARDLEGDYLSPGAVDLHTDNLERQVQPRAGTRWPSRSALLAHDAQCAAAGVTTVLDALCVGDLGFDEDRPRTCAEGVRDLTALAPTGLLKSEHYLHLRCELPAEGMIALLQPLAHHPLLRMVSLMDHTPGIGQYGDLAQYRAMRLRDGEAPDAIEIRIDFLAAQRARLRDPNRASLMAMMRGRGLLASHDDRTEAEIAENLADGIAIAEFPVTMQAARAARAGGQTIIAGAPNLVRGGSHTGNVAVIDLLRAGLVDALASDYVPCSMIEAAFLAAKLADIALPRAISLIADAPARMAGFSDRGRIEPGARADLVRVRMHDGAPVVREVWQKGVRVS